MGKVKTTQNALKRMIYESISKVFEEARLDKYGAEIPRYGQGWGKDDTLRNRQGYNQDGTKGPWFSRSVAVATGVLLQDTETGKWFILANQRGTGTPDYQGYWNLPCGYLDYNEEAEEAAAREVYEETGIRLNSVKYFGHSTSPNENRQNVCFFFVSFLKGKKSQFNFSKDNMEEGEVEGIQWLPIEKSNTLKWAFDHDELVKKILSKYSNTIYGSKPFDGQGGKMAIIDRALETLENGGDTEYAIKLLKAYKQYFSEF